MRPQDLVLFLASILGAAILLWEATALLTGNWRLTLSELTGLHPSVGIYFVLIFGIVLGAVVGHLGTVLNR